MRPELRLFADAEELGEALAGEVLARYAEATRAGRRFLLGCPGGRSLRSTYRALAARRADLRDLVVVMMDEYVEPSDSVLVAVSPDVHYSTRGFALREIVGPLGIADENVWIPDPAHPAAYDERIAAAGGIDLFLVASGASDGHVAFLGPGSRLDARTAVVQLAATTRRDNLATFPDFGSLAEVPTHGVSVGLGTIAAARRVRLVLQGAEKAGATARLLALDGFDPAWPASLVYACADPEIWVDRAALGVRGSEPQSGEARG
jgi:glucosamine-6-phosphate deaminase